ncbi:MAG: arylsulfotransferase family protein [Planctomycetota bacterium]|jgi:hypothetical protein
MKLSIVVSTLLILVIISYVMGFIGNPFLFIIFLYIALIVAFFVIFLITTSMIWNQLPLNIKKIHENHKIRFNTIILSCFIFFVFGGWVINRYYLPEKFSLISLLVDVVFLLLSILLGWSLIKPNKKTILFTGIIATVLFSFIFTFTHIKYYRTPYRTPITHSSKIEALKSLPYLTYVLDDKYIEKDGVTIYKKSLSNKGINIYNSYFLPGAYLLDLSGNILHTYLPQQSNRGWHYVEMYDESDLLVIVKDLSLMRLDWNSNIKWATEMRFHHDIAIDDNKDIYALARKDELVFSYGLPLPIINDYIVMLSADGKIKKELSLYKILKKNISNKKLDNIYRWIIIPKNIKAMIKQKMVHGFIFKNDTPMDILHTNTIEVINKDINNIFKKGNILFCSKMLNLIGVINIKEESLLWSWGLNNLELPHHPTLLENGNILIFDNGASSRKYSRIIELNPSTKKIVWKYEGSPSESFYSSWGGANQRLESGNTLITESTKGRVFEITKNGDIVWEFYNPDKEKNGKRATIYRMMRITYPEQYLFIKELLKSGK